MLPNNDRFGGGKPPSARTPDEVQAEITAHDRKVAVRRAVAMTDIYMEAYSASCQELFAKGWSGDDVFGAAHTIAAQVVEDYSNPMTALSLLGAPPKG